MTKINVVYRCCEEDSKKQFRPDFFCKLDCLENFLEHFKYDTKVRDVEINIIAVHDGPEGKIFDRLEYHDLDVHKINFKSNEKSLLYSLSLGNGFEGDIVYFVEDDYLHREHSVAMLIEGIARNPHGIVSGYDHTDRYTRIDDIDYERTKIILGEKCYWRTAESTTCTWATHQDNFAHIFPLAINYKLDDRGFFRAMYASGNKLITPMPGFSTHCHIPYMSPFIDWTKE